MICRILYIYSQRGGYICTGSLSIYGYHAEYIQPPRQPYILSRPAVYLQRIGFISPVNRLYFMWQKLYKTLKGLPQKRIAPYRYWRFKSERPRSCPCVQIEEIINLFPPAMKRAILWLTKMSLIWLFYIYSLQSVTFRSAHISFALQYSLLSLTSL